MDSVTEVDSEVNAMALLLIHCELRGFKFNVNEVGDNHVVVGTRNSIEYHDTIYIGPLTRCWALRVELAERTPVRLVRGTASEVMRAALHWGVIMTFRSDDKVADALK